MEQNDRLEKSFFSKQVAFKHKTIPTIKNKRS